MGKTPGKDTAKQNRPRFDVQALKDRAGAKTYARGVEYHEDGQVEIVSLDAKRVIAKVAGSEIYDITLSGIGNEFSGRCSCPAYSDWGFCKHMVATALTVNDLAPEAVKQFASRLSGIRDHLRAKSVDELATMIMGFAERYPELLDDLELAAATDAVDDDALLAQLKNAITAATKVRGYVEYRDVPRWAGKIEALLDRIEPLIDTRATTALKVLDHFFARMDDALGSIDDSEGLGGGACARAAELHLDACRKAKPDPIALARDLFNRELDSYGDSFYAPEGAYEDVLGEAGLAEYRRLANEAWQKTKPRRPGRRRLVDDGGDAEDRRDEIRAILERFAKRDGDVDAQIALRTTDLSSAYDYLGLADLCLQNRRNAEALKWAEEGLWQSEDNPDRRLVDFVADLYKKSGRHEDAENLLWRTFERQPSMELYRRLKGLARRRDVAATRDRALKLVKAKLGKRDLGLGPWWSAPTTVALELMIEEGLLAEAWEMAGQHGCNQSLLKSLAKQSEKTFPQNSLEPYAAMVERLILAGGDDSYREAGKLIKHMRGLREGLGQTAEHAAYLAEVMSRHKAKRNFMKVLASQ